MPLKRAGTLSKIERSPRIKELNKSITKERGAIAKMMGMSHIGGPQFIGSDSS
jgi:hypothetical protein